MFLNTRSHKEELGVKKFWRKSERKDIQKMKNLLHIFC